MPLNKIPYPALATFSKNKRIQSGPITIGWRAASPRNLFEVLQEEDEEVMEVKLHEYSMVLYESGTAIGKAEFRSYTFMESCEMDDFVNLAGSVSAEMGSFASGLRHTLDHLTGGCEVFYGMRVIEFKLLEMKPNQSKESKWVKPVNTFIRTMFKENDFYTNFAMVLCPFPLEYHHTEGIRGLSEQKFALMNSRRKALVRLYKKTLGVELAVPETEPRWWMGKLLN